MNEGPIGGRGALIAMLVVGVGGLSFAGCGKKDDASEAETKGKSKKTEKDAKKSGVAPLEVLTLRDITSVDGIKQKLTAWGDNAFYESGTVFLTIDHPRYEKVYVTVNSDTGTPTTEFRLAVKEGTTAQEIDELAARLKLVHPLYKQQRKEVEDAISEDFEHKFGPTGKLPFATLSKSGSSWMLSLCGHHDRNTSLADFCWGGLEHALTDRVVGVDPDCYEGGKHCIAKRRSEIEKIAGEVMFEIEAGDMLLGEILLKGDRFFSHRELEGKTYIYLSSTSEEDDTAVVPIIAKYLSRLIKDTPLTKGVAGLLFLDWKGEKTMTPL